MTETKLFTHDKSNSSPWNAYEAAEDYARSLGYSVGSMQSGSPTALFRGYCYVSKWRNLTSEEQENCDGTITAVSGRRFQESDIVVTLKKAEAANARS